MTNARGQLEYDVLELAVQQGVGHASAAVGGGAVHGFERIQVVQRVYTALAAPCGVVRKYFRCGTCTARTGMFERGKQQIYRPLHKYHTHY